MGFSQRFIRIGQDKLNAELNSIKFIAELNVSMAAKLNFAFDIMVYFINIFKFKIKLKIFPYKQITLFEKLKTMAQINKKKVQK